MNKNAIGYQSMMRNKHGVNWRAQAAEQMSRGELKGLTKYYDRSTILASEYLCSKRERKIDGSTNPILRRIRQAEILEGDKHVRQTASILVVGGVDAQEIADMCAVSSDVIQVWEELYFDVRRLRDCPGWIRGKVIRPLEESGESVFAGRLKAALAGGPHVAKLVIKADIEIPYDDADRLLNAELKMHQKFCEVSELPIGNSAQAQKFSIQYCQHIHDRQKLDLARQKFQEKCAAEQRKHELAIRSLEHKETVARYRFEVACRKEQSRVEIEQAKRAVTEKYLDYLLASDIEEQRLLHAHSSESELSQQVWESNAADEREVDVVVAGKIDELVDQESTVSESDAGITVVDRPNRHVQIARHG